MLGNALKTAAISALAALSLVLAPAAQAADATDTEGPRLISVGHTGATTSAHFGDTVLLAVRAEDPSGIASVRAYSETPGGWQRMTCEPELHGSNWEDPDVWVLRGCGWGTDVPPSAVSIARLVLMDGIGNTTEVTDRAILDPLSYNIENADFDGEAPVLESVTVEPRVAVPGQDVTVTLRIRESSARLSADYSLEDHLPTGQTTYVRPERYGVPDNEGGVFTIVDTFRTDAHTPYGQYRLGTLYLWDYRGNAAELDTGAAIQVDDPAHPVGTTSVGGTAVVKGTLTAQAPWITTGMKAVYGWRTGWDFVPGATTLPVKVEDAGKAIGLQVTATWPDGTVRIRTAESAPIALAPLGIGPVAVKGTPAVGRTLTASHQMIDPTQHPAPKLAFHTYTWFRDGVQIPNHSWQDYTATAADMGHKLSVQVRSNAPGHTPATTTSPAVAIAPGTLKAPTPTYSGEAGIGYLQGATVGAWTSGTTLRYQWLRNGKAITGATAKTYRSTTADKNQVLQIRVTGTKAGYTTAVRTSGAKRPVTGLLGATAPRVEGTNRVGGKLTSYLPVTWTPGTAMKYQWQRNGRNITGATRTSYVPVAADRGQHIRLRATGTKAGYTTAVRYSAAKRPGYGVLASTPPRITGTALVGRKMTADPGNWTRGTTVRYQWLREDSTWITGATSRTYVLRPADRHKIVSVRVTGSKPGYRSVVNYSTVRPVK